MDKLEQDLLIAWVLMFIEHLLWEKFSAKSQVRQGSKEDHCEVRQNIVNVLRNLKSRKEDLTSARTEDEQANDKCH